MSLSRRTFLGFLAAPAIIRVAEIMPIKPVRADVLPLFEPWPMCSGAFSPAVLEKVAESYWKVVVRIYESANTQPLALT